MPSFDKGEYMAKFKVVIADYYYEGIAAEKKEIGKLDAILEDYHCKTEDEVIAVARDADALVVQFTPITRRVVESLEKCKVIVRYAIGLDNIDMQAAAERGIYVCNVPDYSLDEVSNQAILLLLACARKLTILVNDVRKGNWNYTVAKPIHRIAGKVLELVGLGHIPSLVAQSSLRNVAWYSVEAVKSLQRKVAEEVVRVLSGEMPRNPVNTPVGR